MSAEHFCRTFQLPKALPIQINLLMGDVQVIDREQRLACQRLVNLEEITVIKDKSCQGEDEGDGV